MQTIQRTDTLKLDGIETTPQGFLRFPVFMGRTGVQVYRKMDGSIVREFRPEDEVFRAETMAGLKSIPVTNNHPTGNVTPENAKDLMVGFGSETVERIDKGNIAFQKGIVTITDKQAIQDINEGKIEVSLGYDVEIDETPGEHGGVKYDAVQRKITPNHLALVDKGRAGSEVRLRFDSDAILLDETINKTHKGDTEMAKLKIGDQEFEVDKELKEAYDTEMEKMKGDQEEAEKKAEDAEETAKEAEKKAEDAEEEKKAAEEKADAMEAKLDSANAKLKKADGRKDSAEIHKLVKERKSLELNAAKVLDEETVKKLDSIDDSQEIKKMVIKAEFPEADLSKKSDAYVNARFDAIVETLEKSSEQNSKAGDAFKGNRESKIDADEVAKKRKERQDQAANQWQKPIGKSTIQA